MLVSPARWICSGDGRLGGFIERTWTKDSPSRMHEPEELIAGEIGIGNSDIDAVIVGDARVACPMVAV